MLKRTQKNKLKETLTEPVKGAASVPSLFGFFWVCFRLLVKCFVQSAFKGFLQTLLQKFFVKVSFACSLKVRFWLFQGYGQGYFSCSSEFLRMDCGSFMLERSTADGNRAQLQPITETL